MKKILSWALAMLMVVSLCAAAVAEGEYEYGTVHGITWTWGGLADQAERLRPAHVEAHVVHGLDRHALAAPARREILAQVLDLQHIFLLRHARLPPSFA